MSGKKIINIHQAKPMITPNQVQKNASERKREDSWSNIITGIGTNQDKRTGNRVRHDIRTPEFFEQAYGGSAIMGRIVDLVPAECLRNWVDWVGVDKEVAEKVQDRCEELDLQGALLRTWIWARAFGGGCLYLVTDTDDPSRPLQAGEKVIALRDLSRWDLRILTTDIDYDFGSVNFGFPKIYYLNLQMGAQFKGYPIHWTRMIRFDGQLVPRRTFIANNYWHDSVINKPYNSVRNYESSNDAAATCLQDFNVDIYKMKNLANMVSSGAEDLIKKRIELISFSKSVIRAMMLDADDEDYENKGRSLEGVPDLLRMQANRMVADTDLPHTKLLGESPDGSNSTGNSTSQNFYNFLSSEQKNLLKPKMKRAINVIFPELTPKLSFNFRPLRELDDNEKAELRSKQSTTDKNYIDAGVLTPQEVADSRFGGEEYSLETELDHDAREAGLIGEGMTAFNELGMPQPQQQLPKKKPEEPDGGLPPSGGSKSSPVVEKDAASDAQTEGNNSGTQFATRNVDVTPKNAIPKDKAFISQTMSLPMRDPKIGDDSGKGPGTPIKARRLLPTRGTGTIAPSGYDFEKDAGSEGEPLEQPAREDSKEALEDDWITSRGAHIEVGEDGKHKNGPFKGESHQPTGKGSKNGKKPKEEKKPKPKHSPSGHGGEGLPGLEAATQLAEKLKEGGEKGDHLDAESHANKRAATIVVKKGDSFLMGKRADTGRWTLPGGVVEKGESMHQGGMRELEEETGLKANRLKFLGSRMTEPKAGQNVQVTMYQHHDDEANPSFENDPDKEIVEWQWIPIAGPIPEEIANNLQHPNNVALSHLGLI